MFVGQDILVESIVKFQTQNLLAREIVYLVYQYKDFSIQTRLNQLNFLVFNTPKLRYILHIIWMYFLNISPAEQPTKLFITENILLNAYYIEFVYKFIYLNAEMLHARLLNAKCVQLVKRFKNLKNTLIMLVIMYQVSLQGVNLNLCCSKVIVIIFTINALSKIQVWSCIIWVSYVSAIPVWVLTFFVPDYRYCKPKKFWLLDSSFSTLIISIEMWNR